MAALLKPIGLVFSLLALIAITIVIPAIQFQVVGDWRVIFLAIAYFVFFLGTVWRVIRYGQLASRQEDRQVRDTSGRIVAIVTVFGLLGVHWLSLYVFSLQQSVLNTTIFVSQIAIQTLGQFFDRLTIKSEHQLVTRGIYRFIRHPIYTSYILLFLGFCIMLQSFLGLSFLLAVCVVWFGDRIAIEEKMLEEHFSEEYQVYCQQTKRLFPYIY